MSFTWSAAHRGRKGYSQRGGRRGEFLIPIKEEGSTVTSLLM